MNGSRIPIVTLVALLAASVAVVAGGILLAKRESIERKQVGREEISEFTGTMEDELARLDALFESHLVDLAERVEPGSEIAIRAAGSHLKGLKQISIVPVQGRGIHAGYPLREDGQRHPLPVFSGNEMERAGGREVFEFEPAGAQGWIGDWFYFFRYDPGYYVVIATDRRKILEATQDWVRQWYVEDFEPVGATGAAVEIEGPQGKILGARKNMGARPDVGPRYPDLIIPLKSRCGQWRIAAWDEVVTTASYHPPTLMMSSVLALGLALLGTVAFSHQRKWHRLAEQRVSFVNRVSHELRTPLTNILLNTDLAGATMESSPEEAGRRMGLVREEAERLSRLITNVLDFSRSGKDGVDLRSEPIELASLAKSILDPFRPALTRRGIEVELDVDPTTHALGDPDAITQILSNLISNVEKYASSGGWMKIAGSGDADVVRLAVSDRGPGILEGAEDRVFAPFERLGERVDEGVTGTGLGLAIARDLARRMGGEIRLEKRNPQGARFVLSLLAAPENIIGIGQRIAS